MSDIVERLRDSDTIRRIGESYADVHDRRQADRDEAADTITRLRYDLADAITEQQWQRGKADDLGKLASSLTARVEELEGALNPFADESLWSGPDHEFVTVKRSDCDRARSVITASQPAPQPWRPIETAPTDGTVVLVFAEERQGLPAFQCTAAYHEDAGWCVDELREVTHWMPLPPQPQKESSND